MRFKDRLDKFLQLQKENMKFEDISKELGISPSTLRSFLYKRGYKQDSGRYVIKENITYNRDAAQVEFKAIESKSKSNETIKKSDTAKITPSTEKKIEKNKSIKNKNTANIDNSVKKQVTIKNNIKKNTSNKSNSNTVNKLKKDRKINITQEDIDKLCEVYDWYLQVKDNKTINKKNNKSNKKDIRIDEIETKDLKSTSIKVNKNVWQEFERLCSNSNYSKQEILTQALVDFMKEYKNLL